MPEAGAAPVSQELLPPLPVRQGPSPPLEGVEVTPVLTHSRMRREQREQQVLVQQQAVGLLFDRLADFRTERGEGPHVPRRVDPHPQVDHHEVGIGRQVGRCPVGARVTGQPSTLIAQQCNPSPDAMPGPHRRAGKRLDQDQSARSHSDTSAWAPHAGHRGQISPFCPPSLDRAEKAQPCRSDIEYLSQARCGA